MRAAGMSAADLAKALNEALLALTGRMGDLTDRTIRRMLSGQTRWPQSRQLKALEAVFGSTGEALGFIKPTRAKPKPLQEDPMQRRTFAATAVAVAIPTPITASPRIGRSDLERMQAALDALSVQEQRSGGSAAVETEALTQAQMAVDLVNHGQATTSIRRAVYSLAANATMAAAWAALDARAMDRAQRHLERALMLAGYSGDSVVTLRAWNYMALLSSQRQKPGDAQAAAERVRGNAMTRRDPLYASLGHARYALALSHPARRPRGPARHPPVRRCPTPGRRRGAPPRVVSLLRRRRMARPVVLGAPAHRPPRRGRVSRASDPGAHPPRIREEPGLLHCPTRHRPGQTRRP